jgi:hypothetical protein
VLTVVFVLVLHIQANLGAAAWNCGSDDTSHKKTRIGRSVSRIRPDTIFDTIDWSPNPMPTASAPAIKAIFCRSKPIPVSSRAKIAEDRDDGELEGPT